MKRIYPKTGAPLTWAVLNDANARADRWMKRYYEEVAKNKVLQAELDELRKELDISTK